jgi:transcription elongation factor GreA
MVSGMDANPSTVMSRSEYEALVEELDSLRAAHRSELAQRLHDVRAHGTTSDDDDRLAVVEETAIGRARITQLEILVRAAIVLDEDAVATDGTAGLGSTVAVADEAGRTTEYRLVGRRTSGSPPNEVSLASPVGQALAGARTGDVVRVALPNGRDRTLTVLDIIGIGAQNVAAAA